MEADMGQTGRWPLLASLLIFAVTAFRIVYVGWLTPLDLATDEAHYWDWARRLDWSYYSKGPLVAWLIALSQWLFQSLFSAGYPETLAVRFPAIVSGAFFLAGVYRLTQLIYRSGSLAFATMAVVSILPATTAGGVLMTIDAPFICLWTWSIIAGHRALFGGSVMAWPALGLLLGFGILAKYTMLLWPFSAVLFCLATPDFRRVLLLPGLWSCAAVAAICCLPILIWNIQHDWISLKHVAGQAGAVEQKSLVRLLGPLEYLAGQLGVGVVVWTVVWMLGVWRHRPGVETQPQKLYLWWLSVPTFLLFWAVSVRVSVPANWPIAGFVSGLVLASDWFSDAVQHSRFARRAAILGCVVAVLASMAALDSRPLIPVMVPIVKHDRVRAWDPTCRLRGWKWLAGRVDEVRDEIFRKELMEPVLATDRWNVAGEVGFYARGKPHVLSVGRPTGDRYSQYDLWRPNPIDDAQAYLGRTFVLVGEPKDEYPDAFERIEPPIKYEYRERGELVAWWWIQVGYGYKGFPVSVKSGRH
jgi:4-amino-4-deoxy-L-arabinose transferase-like glycosyltransferase